MAKYLFGDIVREIKEKVDRDNNPYDYFIAGDHMDTDELHLLRRGLFEGSDVGPAFIRVFKPGQVLYGSRRTYLRKVAVADFEGVTANTTFVLESKDESILLQSLLPFIMQSDRFVQHSIKRSKGSTNPYVLFSDLADYEVDLPDIPEQKRLSEVLWAIDSVKMSYKRLISATDDLVKSQFIEMFGEPKNSPDVVNLETAFTIRDDLRRPINDAVRSEMHTGKLYPYYGANGKVDDINEFLMDCDAICLAEDCGSYGAGEPTSYIVTGKCWVNNHAHVLIPKENCDIEFANVYFRILDMTEYVTGTTRLKLTQAKMKTIPFVLPSMTLQRQFAEFVRQSDKSKLLLGKTLDFSS